MFLLFFRHDFCWVIDITVQYDVLAAKKVHSFEKSRLVENRLNWPNYRYFVLSSRNAKMGFAALTSAKCALVPVSAKTWMQLYGCVSYKLTIWKFWEIPRKRVFGEGHLSGFSLQAYICRTNLIYREIVESFPKIRFQHRCFW